MSDIVQFPKGDGTRLRTPGEMAEQDAKSYSKWANPPPPLLDGERPDEQWLAHYANWYTWAQGYKDYHDLDEHPADDPWGWC